MNRRSSCPLTFAASAAVSAAQLPLTLQYTILSNGKPAGGATGIYNAGGRVDSSYEFNDRGRSPKISAHYLLGSNGWPSRIDITGVDYLKAPVDEHFAAENGQAHWKSTSENGKAPAEGFFASNNGSSAETAFLVAALMKAKGSHLKLLPAGEAVLERVADVTLESHGQKLHVSKFAITGLPLRR